MIPPTNLQAEQKVLGTMLATGTAPPGNLRLTHFADPVHGLIYAAIRLRLDNDEPADVPALQAALEPSGALDEAGGTAYLAQLVPQADPDGKIAWRSVLEAWARRRLIDLGEELAAVGVQMASLHEPLAPIGRDLVEQGEHLAKLGFDAWGDTP